MNEEIKKYLDNSGYKFKDVDENGNEKELTLSGLIEELLEQNRRLKELCEKLSEEHNTYYEIWKNDIQRIDKAVEYIKTSMNNPQPFYEYLYGDENGSVENLDKLLNILQGENNDNGNDN